jgi:hypothetical protein
MRRTTVSAVFVGVALVGGAAAVFTSQREADTSAACWGSLETGQSVCAADDAELDRVLLDDYGVFRVHGSLDTASSSGALARPVGLEQAGRLRAVVIGVTLYAGASMSGSYIDLTFDPSDGRPCGGSSAWLGEYKLGWLHTWDGNVSSFQVRAPGCRVIGYAGGDFRGTDTGAVTSATSTELAGRGLNKAISSIETISE